MSRIGVAPIVEGHGEVASMRILLWRIWTELLGGEHIEVIQPIRHSRGKLMTDDADLSNAIHLALAKLSRLPEPKCVLLLVDAEEDCRQGSPPLGPRLLERARRAHAAADVFCVVANVMFETWFVAAAASLQDYLDLNGADAPSDPEGAGYGKGWIKEHFIGHYSETADQPSLTAAMDLNVVRATCPSFDKLCRELESRRV